MKIEKFGEFKTGTLVPITIAKLGVRDHAFIPNALPPSFSMNDQLWRAYAAATKVLHHLNGACKRLVNPQLLIRPLQQREAIHSSKIEGTYTTMQAFLFAELESQGRGGTAEIDEQTRQVHNYYAALRMGFDGLADGGKIDATLVKSLHERLLQGVKGHDNKPGSFRTEQAFVGNPDDRRRYTPPPPEELDQCLENFWTYCENDDELPALVRAFVAHYQFEAIHPFSDGNGRVGRLLLSLCACVWEELDLPWLHMSEHFDKTRSEYIRRLFAISTEAEWREWLLYCLKGAESQARDSLRRIDTLHDIERHFREKVAKKKRLPALIDSLMESPILKVSDVTERFQTTYETARTDLLHLENLGIIREIENVRPRTYYCPSICKVVYEDKPVDSSAPA